jgi:transcriptional regulator with XRE-family HTH domain
MQTGHNWIDVENSGIDGRMMRPKNRRVLDEDRIRIGNSLRRRREALGLDQIDVAKKGVMLAGGTFAVGTVQNIEYGKRKVTREKIDLYARVVGTTVDELLNPDTVQPPDPKWRDLNREHLEIARRYRNAYKTVRTAVEWLLDDNPEMGEAPVAFADLVMAIQRAAEGDAVVLDAILVLIERRGLLTAIAKRLEADPLFEDRLRALINNKLKPE